MALLACPECGNESLVLEADASQGSVITEGRISCSRCERVYPILRGIPRLYPNAVSGVKHQSRAYSFYHSLHSKESTFRPDVHRDVMLGTLGYEPEEMRSLTILDAGCGIGRYADALARLAPEGTVVAMDMSLGVEAAKENLSSLTNCHFVQGDISNPPFRKDVFDAVVSWGVIHHTPNPRVTFARLTSVLKLAGRFGIYVYEFHPVVACKNWSLLFASLVRQGLLIRPLRFICSRLPVPIVLSISTGCRWIAALMRFDPFGVANGPPGDRFNAVSWRAVFIDRFHSRFAFEHSYQEMIAWFFQEGFNNVVIPSGCTPITMSGRKGRPLSEPMSNEVSESIGVPRTEYRSWSRSR